AIEAMLDKPMDCVDSANLGRASRINDAAGRYIEFCKGTFPSELSLEGYKIVVDCANGATYHIAPNVMRELGAEVLEIGTKPDGLNINEKCGATDIKALQKVVVEAGADVGLAYDGDGDRLIMVDHLGNKVDGDQILFILAREALRSGKLQGGVVGTLMSNMSLELALKELAIPFSRANVGDRYVLEQLKEKGWKLGGENSGHIIVLDKNTTGDGIIASLQVLAAMASHKLSLNDLAKAVPLFPQVLLNVRFEKGAANPLESNEVKAVAADVEKRLAGKGRILLRKSGTEPLIRVMVECEDAVLAQSCAEEIVEAVKRN
ncbi:TPA: phosphoglucosamine mutase, partial [Mannheimia haemolytica]|nr:phosphoglucosamine mutase [Mannheimia haemolytica]